MTINKTYILAALAFKKILFLVALYASTADASTVPQLPPVPILASVSSVSGFQTFGQGIPLSEFLRITLGEMAGRAYVLTPDAAQNTASVSADFTRVKLKNPVPVVRALLDGMGLSMREVGEVLLIERKRETAEYKANLNTFIYKPKHRAVGSLSSYFSLFPELNFSFNTGIATKSFTPTSASGASSAAPGGSISANQDSGATTFSAINQDPTYLVVQGVQADITKFKSFLEQVDVAVPEVLLRAYVFEVRDNQSTDSAVQLVLNVLGGRFGLSVGSALSTESVRLTLPNLSVAVSALAGDSRVRLVSSPVLRAADGTMATATIGTDTPTLGAIVTNNGSSTQSVTYQSAGVILSVSPRILDDSIRLSISQELSSFVKTETGLGDTPTKLRRAFKSDVVARHGEAILLGGLSEVQESRAERTGFFGLGGSRATSSSSSEIVVLLNVERIDAEASERNGTDGATHSPVP